MSDRLSKYMSDRMPHRMSEYMSDRISAGGNHSKKVIESQMFVVKHSKVMRDTPTCTGPMRKSRLASFEMIFRKNCGLAA